MTATKIPLSTCNCWQWPLGQETSPSPPFSVTFVDLHTCSQLALCSKHRTWTSLLVNQTIRFRPLKFHWVQFFLPGWLKKWQFFYTSQGLFTFFFKSEWESLGLRPANLSTLGLDSTKSTSRGVPPKWTFANLVLLNSRVVWKYGLHNACHTVICIDCVLAVFATEPSHSITWNMDSQGGRGIHCYY